MKNTSEHKHLRQAPWFICALVATLLYSSASASPDQKGVQIGKLVVIDPGHGGSNTGAPSLHRSLFEKHVTLALASELRARLQKQGVRVRLTRDRDHYLTLRKRGELANLWGADLFVSLHTNATESHSQRGYETFVLTPKAVEIDGRALRGASKRPRSAVDPQTAALLDDIETSTVQPKAARLASAIQAELQAVRGKEGNRGVRQGSMHVLLGATMPAVLVEIGFIDHPVEGPELLDAKRRANIADALSRAILSQL
jgi:N-acetylmuramoyl-L-alanine amidase